jgi:hypothetical protein
MDRAENSHVAAEKMDLISLTQRFQNCRCERVRKWACVLDFDGVGLVIGLGKKPE